MSILEKLNQLKRTLRMGWLESGIPPSEAEDVAQHSFETTSITILIGDQLQRKGVEINLGRAIEMAVIHDWSEAIMGDLSREVSLELGEEIKNDLEEESLEELVGELPDGEKYLELWREYLGGESIEARLVKSADLLSILVELINYRDRGWGNEQLNEIWDNVRGELATYGEEFAPVGELLVELDGRYSD
ncbi:hypothetical protein AKJ47_00835 [candidate division MSBL1 archaeon SCGC-AAA261G05]|uniref:5'-deoxynucleotidase n=1 Tax=candidate division MSBL1 archaeon SCGC-AAA261G05 TaxID=1698276 RepID=A0A133VC98_9EURY|nr:hypothetical protein AKJ47_00835 [candidate division MSBL1 archaeon SCGC-AAA261G05]